MKHLPKIVLLLVVVGLIGFAGVMGYGYTLLQPVSSSEAETERFVVAKGESVAAIAQKLHEAGLIRHPLVFKWVVRQQKLDGKIQAGSFDLSPSMKVQDIAAELTQGTQDVWITLLEGWRAQEIAEYLAAQELDAFDEAEFMDLADSSEGQLFPDTYLVPREITAATLHSLLTNTFETKVLEGLSAEIAQFEQETPYTFEQALVMASLVEREARTYDQMRHVAGILWNRLDIGMALQVDATLQYAKGYNVAEQSWWAPPSSADKRIVSPYNTYLNPGLPPRPISNPSLNAIKAALDPAKVDDLFYVHAPDGSMYYAQTLDEHNANINRYLR